MQNPGIRFERPPTTQEAVLLAIRRHIRDGRIPPGAPIRQTALAERLGVSRIPVREALLALEAEGLVAHSAHRGYTVCELGEQELVEVNRIRMLLEGEAVRAAVPALGGDHLRRLAGALEAAERYRGSPSTTEYADLNRAYHFSLFEASGMPRLVKHIEMLWNTYEPYRALHYVRLHDDEGFRTARHAEHRAILEAASNGEAEKTVRLLDEHRVHGLDTLRSLVGDDPRP
ncbi:MAG: GntR family transcriptional regulator [Actinomycetota bacterium]